MQISVDELEHQGEGERSVDEQIAVALYIPAVVLVEVNGMGVVGEGRKSKEEVTGRRQLV